MSSPIPFTQHKITLPEGVAAILTLPQISTPPPGVLLLHGFLSQKDEVGGFYRLLAVSLATRGITSLRIDFRGCGESEGDTQDMTIHQQVQDARNAYRWLSECGRVDPDRLGMVGFSLGAAIAMITTMKHPGSFKSLVLLSPVAHMHHDLQNKYGREVFIQAAQSGVAEIDTGWVKHLVKTAFFKSLDDYNLSECIKSYTGALLALAGDQDYSASNATLLAASSPAKPKEALILTGTDHVFGILGEDKSIAAAVIELTSRWLVETL
jgi:pimeloyl-ACP methyl ester carboxylesterase